MAKGKITFKFKDIKKTLEGVRRDINLSIKYAMGKYSEDLKRAVQKRMVEQGVIATGAMRRDVDILIDRSINKYILKIINKQPYMNYVDRGTTAHYPPISPIKKWAAIKFGGTVRDAYAIRASIGKKGTKAHPFTAFVFNQEKPRAAKIISRYIKQRLNKMRSKL